MALKSNPMPDAPTKAIDAALLVSLESLSGQMASQLEHEQKRRGISKRWKALQSHKASVDRIITRMRCELH